jgi:2-polyprenyl-6-methoxyphenol hydroxylase-like FAD-dependent oxidoreductase
MTRAALLESKGRQMGCTTRIAVIGAGLGGLTAAAYLQRTGYAVQVYEQTDSFDQSKSAR